MRQQFYNEDQDLREAMRIVTTLQLATQQMTPLIRLQAKSASKKTQKPIPPKKDVKASSKMERHSPAKVSLQETLKPSQNLTEFIQQLDEHNSRYTSHVTSRSEVQPFVFQSRPGPLIQKQPQRTGQGLLQSLQQILQGLQTEDSQDHYHSQVVTQPTNSPVRTVISQFSQTQHSLVDQFLVPNDLSQTTYSDTMQSTIKARANHNKYCRSVIDYKNKSPSSAKYT